MSIALYERKSKFDSNITFETVEIAKLGDEVKRISKRLYKKVKANVSGISNFVIIY